LVSSVHFHARIIAQGVGQIRGKGRKSRDACGEGDLARENQGITVRQLEGRAKEQYQVSGINAQVELKATANGFLVRVLSGRIQRRTSTPAPTDPVEIPFPSFPWGCPERQGQVLAAGPGASWRVYRSSPQMNRPRPRQANFLV
jgi:hypothetical protein